MTITRTLVAALAAFALAVPAAQAAQPPDMHASVAMANAQANRQDMRSPDARDAALNAVQPAPAVNAPGATAVDSQSKVPAAPSAPVAPADDGIDWTTIALGIAGSLIAVGGIALLATRRTRQTHRVRATA